MINDVIFTGTVPQCPFCKKPTKRQEGCSVSTLVYYIPTYNEEGTDINPDRNCNTTDYHCCECNTAYSVICKNNFFVRSDNMNQTPTEVACETIKCLYKIGLVDEKTMAKFDAMRGKKLTTKCKEIK